MSTKPLGIVYLVGAGPGDPELITLKGKRRLETAQVVLYDELVNRELLDFAPSDAELIYVGKKAGSHCAEQRQIEALLIFHARRGKTVVRLKGGDPFVFGRGGEEAQALRRAAIPYEIVPGVSSAIAVPAYAGIPVTHRSCSSSFAVVTGHRSSAGAVKWGEIAQSVDTMVILMGLHRVEAIMGDLAAAGCDPERPVALIEGGTTARQRVVYGSLQSIAELATQQKLISPTMIIVGDVVRLGRQLDWFVAYNSPATWQAEGVGNGTRAAW